jgi:transposase
MLGAQGLCREVVAKKTKMDIRTLGRCLERYRDLGLDGIDDKEHPGRRPKLSEAEFLELKNTIRCGPEEAGFSTGIWTSSMIVEMIFKKYGVRYSSSHVTRILHKIGLSYQLPKKTLEGGLGAPEAMGRGGVAAYSRTGQERRRCVAIQR